MKVEENEIKTVKTTYIADDETRFDSKTECSNYESFCEHLSHFSCDDEIMQNYKMIYVGCDKDNTCIKTYSVRFETAEDITNVAYILTHWGEIDMSIDTFRNFAESFKNKTKYPYNAVITINYGWEDFMYVNEVEDEVEDLLERIIKIKSIETI